MIHTSVQGPFFMKGPFYLVYLSYLLLFPVPYVWHNWTNFYEKQFLYLLPSSSFIQLIYYQLIWKKDLSCHHRLCLVIVAVIVLNRQSPVGRRILFFGGSLWRNKATFCVLRSTNFFKHFKSKLFKKKRYRASTVCFCKKDKQ